jgi:uncharacterized membrane protein HdeD (DUF308 family)
MRTDLPYTLPQKLVASILGGIFPLVVGILLMYYWLETRPSRREGGHELVPEKTLPRLMYWFVHLSPKEVLRLLFGTVLLWMGVALVLSYLYVPNPFNDLPQPINPLNGALLLLFFAARIFWRVVKRQRNERAGLPETNNCEGPR